MHRAFAWPDAEYQIINEFGTSSIAAIAFVKLFTLLFADPIKPDRQFAVSDTDAAAYFLRFAESDLLTGNLHYPFAEHNRFKFWMNDRIRRH